MLNAIDNFLDGITMYRLILYYLAVLVAAALGLGFIGLIPINPLQLLFSTALITFFCWVTNSLFSSFFEAPANIESLYISALIMALILSPAWNFTGLMFLVWTSVWAMASKYVFAIGKKHVFNPVAIAVVITGFALNQSASWWVGTLYMMPFVLAGGLMVARKIRRFDLVLGFYATALAITLGFGLLKGSNLMAVANNALFESPLFFFGFVMLTEPLTTPPTRAPRMAYGALTGFLFTPFAQIGSFFFTPEIALLVGNAFSYLVSSKTKLILKLKEKIKISSDSYDFVFEPTERLDFRPGQYLEWTLPASRADSRGNRRYFTIASSPTEDRMRIGVRFNQKSSTFKQQLKDLGEGSIIVASQLAGDFVLPDDPSEKLVFIAGGIGITPFRSMVKYLLDKNEKRTATLFYSARNPADVAYKDVFDSAQNSLGIKVVYTVTDPNLNLTGWKGRTGFIDSQMIMAEVPDYMERAFYLSGPHSMVAAFERTLQKMGVKRKNIKTDYFPGFA